VGSTRTECSYCLASFNISLFSRDYLFVRTSYLAKVLIIIDCDISLNNSECLLLID